MLGTGISNDIFQKSERLDDTNIQSVQIPSSITYYVQNAFPINIIAAPLAYGNAQLIKTSIVFKFDNFFVDRTSRVGDVLAISAKPWKNKRDASIDRRPTLLSTTLKGVSTDTSKQSATSEQVVVGEEFMGTPVENINQGFYNSNMSRE